MDDKLKKELVIFIVLGLILSYGFNYISTNFMTEELILNGGGFAFLLVSLLIVNPLFFIVFGGKFSKNIKKTWWSILLVASFFHFSMLNFYGTGEGLFYVRNYIIVGYVSMFIGYCINQRTKVNSLF